MGGREGVTTVGDVLRPGWPKRSSSKEVPSRRRGEGATTGCRFFAPAIRRDRRADDFLVYGPRPRYRWAADTVHSYPRRFIPGRTVSIAAQVAERGPARNAASQNGQVPRIHDTVEEATRTASQRAEGRGGRTLDRAIGVTTSSPLRRLRGICSHAGMARRRDAHLDNWVLTDRRSPFLALDLRPSGCRPVGYELARRRR